MQEKKNSTRTNTQEERKEVYERELPTEILKELTEEQVQQYQIWDNISKRLLQIYPRMIFPIIKEIFDEEYPENAKVVFLSMEYVIDRMEKTGEKILRTIRADFVFKIANKDIYHFECQIQPDAQMIIRMYEYDSETAVHHTVRNENGQKIITFPRSVILYLTRAKNTPDTECLRIYLPDDTCVEYTVPVMKVQNYNLSMIHDKKLYAILPLTLLRFKKEPKQKYKEKDIKELTEYIKKVILILEEAYKEGYISEIQKNDIVDYIFRSGRHLFRKDVEILRRINDEIPPFAKLSREIIEELKEDKEEGIEEFINYMKEEHKSTEQCAQMLKRIFHLPDDQTKEKMYMYWPE